LIKDNKIKSKVFYFRIVFKKLFFWIEYILVLIFHVIRRIFQKPRYLLNHEIIFIEKSYQGLFRQSNKNEHYCLSRKAFTEQRDFKLGTFLVDIIDSRFMRFQNSLRFLEKMDRQKGNTIVVIYFSIQMLKYFNPLIFRALNRNHFTTLCILSDGAWSRNKIVSQAYSRCFDFISCWDDPFFPEIRGTRVIPNMFSPFPKTIERPPSFDRCIDVAFIGKTSNRPDREQLLAHIRSAPFKSEIYSESDGFLSTQDYYRIARNSKIMINNSQSFSNHETINQLKGRVFEAMLSGNLLFENKNNLTASMFVPGEHYIEYEDVDSLVKLLEYHIKNFNEIGYNIALNGHLRSCQKFSGSEYWRIVLMEIEGGKSA